MEEVETYFSDLVPEKQKELLKAVGAKNPSEMNWDMDISPIAIYGIED